jgi:hypothetical protein
MCINQRARNYVYKRKKKKKPNLDFQASPLALVYANNLDHGLGKIEGVHLHVSRARILFLGKWVLSKESIQNPKP